MSTHLLAFGIEHPNKVVIATPSRHTTHPCRFSCGGGGIGVTLQHSLVDHTRIVVQPSGQAQVKYNLKYRYRIILTMLLSLY